MDLRLTREPSVQEYKEAKSELLKRRREGLSGEVSTVALDAAGEVLVAGLDRVRKERLLAMLSALHTGFEAHRLHLEDSCEAIRNARPSVVAAATQLSFEEPRIPGRMKIGLPTDVRHVSGAGGPRMLRVSPEAPPALEGDVLRHAFPTASPSPAARRDAALRSPPPLPPRPPLSVMSKGARQVQQMRPPAEGTGEAVDSDDEEWATPDSRRCVRLAGAGGGAWGIGYERGWGVASDSDSGGEEALGEVGAMRDGGEPGGQRAESPDRATPPPDRPPAFAVHKFHAGWRPPPPLLEAPPGTSRWSCGTGSPQAPSWREEGKSKRCEEEGCAGGGEWMVVDAESVGDRKGDGDRTGVNPQEMTPPVGEGRPGSTLVARSGGEATHAWAEPVAAEKAPRAGAAGQSGDGARAEEYEVAGDFEVGGDWVGYRDDHGQPYYYHTRTGHTQWDRPAEFPEAPPDSVRML
jgi:hypothetical protein